MLYSQLKARNPLYIYITSHDEIALCASTQRIVGLLQFYPVSSGSLPPMLERMSPERPKRRRSVDFAQARIVKIEEGGGLEPGAASAQPILWIPFPSAACCVCTSKCELVVDPTGVISAIEIGEIV